MQVSRSVAGEPGVTAALVAMATDLNVDLLAGMGFDPPDDAGPADLLVAVDAADDAAVAGALARLETALTERSAPSAAGFGDAPAPRTIGSAAAGSDATLAFVSTPGAYAFADAMDALESGLSVVVFSDNVSVEHEVRLKDEAARRGLLVMGPDCGTAAVGGVSLGFANVVRPGPVGLVAASGTGAQQVMSLLDGAGVGVSHCLGVGGRDLSSQVRGRSTLAALDLLAADDATELIAVISKPPAPEVAEVVRAHADRLGKPVLFALLGPGQPDLTAATKEIATAAGATWQEPRWWPAPQERTGTYRSVRGLFAGGTLCDEAMLIVADALGEVRSNIPLRPDWALPDDLRAPGHLMIDFGDDRLTRGRPHPMIDGALRSERMLAEAADPDCGVLLLDVVLGHGAHPDPAAELAPAITAARGRAAEDGRDVAVVVALVGTADDPQGVDRQAASIRDAGASVHLSNAAATRKTVELVGAPR
ncbi:MAG: FdrA family protein [Propionibacteriales bacterium]|nr:FdrA family protein [Propionibacteriales bacterium]